MHKPKVWVEPLVAEAKEWHGLRRLRLRVWRRTLARRSRTPLGRI